MWASAARLHVFHKSEGYDYNFVEEPPDSLKCPICLLVVREPQQHGGCGKLFCKSCIRRYQADRNDCPHCRQPLSDYLGHTTIFNDLKSAQEVKSLKVLCKHHCGWTGELRSVDSHLEKDCEESLVKCPNDCNNGNTRIMRKNLAFHLQFKCPNRQHTCPKCEAKMKFMSYNNHLLNECPKRQYTCPHCQETGVYNERTSTHLEVCPEVKILCPKCSVEVFRRDTATHSAICQYETVRCSYYNIGCLMKLLRKDLQAHEEDAQLHLALAIRKVSTMAKKVSTLTNLVVLKNTLTFKVTGFENKKSSNDTTYSPRFRTSPSGYMMCLTVDANGSDNTKGTHVSVFVYLMKGDNDDSLSWPFTGRVTFELLNQLEDKNHHKETITFPAVGEGSQRVVDGEKAEQGWGRRKFISHAKLEHNPLTNCQYLKDDTLVFRVSAEAPDYKPWLECTN